jgi:hypothetical protein
MTRRQLEHIIRAAAATADVRDIVVIGSQALLGAHPAAPTELTESLEADVFPKDDPKRSIVIDGAIGEESLFHRTFGYYAHGVDETTAVLPDGWEQRLVRVENANTMGAVGWCIDVHDLAVSKLAAGRDKDLLFVEAMLRHHFTDIQVIRQRLLVTSRLQPSEQERLSMMLERWR